MLLNGGDDVTVLGEIGVDGATMMICKLNNSIYIRGTLIRYVVLGKHEFKDFVDKISEESLELTVPYHPVLNEEKGD